MPKSARNPRNGQRRRQAARYYYSTSQRSQARFARDVVDGEALVLLTMCMSIVALKDRYNLDDDDNDPMVDSADDRVIQWFLILTASLTLLEYVYKCNDDDSRIMHVSPEEDLEDGSRRRKPTNRRLIAEFEKEDRAK